MPLFLSNPTTSPKSNIITLTLKKIKTLIQLCHLLLLAMSDITDFFNASELPFLYVALSTELQPNTTTKVVL